MSRVVLMRRGASVTWDEIDYADDTNSIWDHGLGRSDLRAQERGDRLGGLEGPAVWSRSGANARIFAGLQSRPLVHEGAHSLVSRRRTGDRVGRWAGVRSSAGY